MPGDDVLSYPPRRLELMDIPFRCIIALTWTFSYQRTNNPFFVAHPPSQVTVSDERVAPTICTRRQKQGFVSLGALRGVFGFGSGARSALVKWSVGRLVSQKTNLFQKG